MLRRDSKAGFQKQTKRPGASVRERSTGCGCLFGLIGAATGALIGVLSGGALGAVVGAVIGAAGGIVVGFTASAVVTIIDDLVSYPKYRFRSGEYRGTFISEEQYHSMMHEQKDNPCSVMQAASQSWWWFQDEFYRGDEGLSRREVKALILQRKRRRERRIKRAIAQMEQEGATGSAQKREPIPDDVKMFVWQRDRGRCVKCGGREKLEFDHIIPLAMGGSNTARNLQLLCEKCNREKGDSLV